jgi:hypothetical protein
VAKKVSWISFVDSVANPVVAVSLPLCSKAILHDRGAHDEQNPRQ